MSKTIAVIGRGIQGQMLASEALRQGHKVLLFGSTKIGDCASISASGVQCQKGLLVAKDPIFKAKQMGHKALWQLIESSSGVRSIRGVYEPCFDQHSYQKRKKRIYRRQFTSMMASNLIEEDAYLPREILLKETQLDQWAKPTFMSFFYPSDYWFHPEDLIAILDKKNSLHPNCHVFEKRVIEADPKTGNFIVEFEGTKTTVQADICLFATGADLSITRRFIPTRFDLKLAPGWSLESKCDTQLQGVAIKQDIMSYAVFDGVLRYGSFADEKTVELERFAEVRERLKEKSLPSSHKLLPGIRVKGKGNRPVIWKQGSLIFSTGLFKSGFSLSAIIAREVLAITHWTDDRFNQKFAVDFGYNN